MSITKQTEEYVQSHPYIQESLRLGLINYSSLAREIEKALGTKAFDAILIALRRYKGKLKKNDNRKEILALLKETKIEVKTKISAFILDKKTPLHRIEKTEKAVREKGESLRLIEGASSITLVVSSDHATALRAELKANILNERSNLIELILKSPKDIESIPGVMSFILSRLAQHNINVNEMLSCWTDTIFIIAEKDFAKAIELLRF
jgi:aspartokinase